MALPRLIRTCRLSCYTFARVDVDIRERECGVLSRSESGTAHRLGPIRLSEMSKQPPFSRVSDGEHRHSKTLDVPCGRAVVPRSFYHCARSRTYPVFHNSRAVGECGWCPCRVLFGGLRCGRWSCFPSPSRVFACSDHGRSRGEVEQKSSLVPGRSLSERERAELPRESLPPSGVASTREERRAEAGQGAARRP